MTNLVLLIFCFLAGVLLQAHAGEYACGAQ